MCVEATERVGLSDMSWSTLIKGLGKQTNLTNLTTQQRLTLIVSSFGGPAPKCPNTTFRTVIALLKATRNLGVHTYSPPQSIWLSHLDSAAHRTT